MAQIVEVVYTPAIGDFFQKKLAYTNDMTAGEALSQSGIFTAHPEVKGYVFGVFSEPVHLSSVLKPGDRLEVYRPLITNPKEKRRHRAKR